MLRVAILVLAIVGLGGPSTAQAGDGEEKIAFNNHCRMCHSFRKDDNRLGPTMYGIYGAKAGQVEGYRGYSGALTGVTWDEETLDRFITNPTSVSTSTNMIFPPVADAGERKKIIGFLKTISTP